MTPEKKVRFQDEEAPAAPKKMVRSECGICNKQFTTRKVPDLHVRMHSGEKPFSCSVCSSRFASTCHLQTHLQIHTADGEHECHVCKAKFSKREHVKVHMRTHSGGTLLECTECDKKFLHANKLKKHLRVHSGEKPYECEVCHKRFADTSGRNGHLRTHTGERPFGCTLCRKKFGDDKLLREHVWSSHIESDKKPKKRIVKKKSSSVLATKRPVEVLHVPVRSEDSDSDGCVHGCEGAFECSVCHEGMSDARALREHVWKVHIAGERHECPTSPSLEEATVKDEPQSEEDSSSEEMVIDEDEHLEKGSEDEACSTIKSELPDTTEESQNEIVTSVKLESPDAEESQHEGGNSSKEESAMELVLADTEKYQCPLEESTMDLALPETEGSQTKIVESPLRISTIKLEAPDTMEWQSEEEDSPCKESPKSEPEKVFTAAGDGVVNETSALKSEDSPSSTVTDEDLPSSSVIDEHSTGSSVTDEDLPSSSVIDENLPSSSVGDEDSSSRVSQDFHCSDVSAEESSTERVCPTVTAEGSTSAVLKAVDLPVPSPSEPHKDLPRTSVEDEEVSCSVNDEGCESEKDEVCGSVKDEVCGSVKDEEVCGSVKDEEVCGSVKVEEVCGSVKDEDVCCPVQDEGVYGPAVKDDEVSCPVKDNQMSCPVKDDLHCPLIENADVPTAESVNEPAKIVKQEEGVAGDASSDQTDGYLLQEEVLKSSVDLPEMSTFGASESQSSEQEAEENPFGLVKGGYMNALSVVESFLKQEETGLELPEEGYLDALPSPGSLPKQNAEENLFECTKRDFSGSLPVVGGLVNQGEFLRDSADRSTNALAAIESYLKQESGESSFESSEYL